MKVPGLIFGILSALGMLLAFIPLLGWLNWVNIPFAIIGLIISALVKSNGGMVLCGIAIILGMLRLMLGGGVF
jgi:hypothetical protein